MRTFIAFVATVAVVAACGTAAEKKEEEEVPAQITLKVTSPTAGTELVGSETAVIVVSGTVETSDPSRGALEAWVNGQRIAVVAGAFSTRLTPEPGINHLKIEGGDGIGALVGQELDVLWAPAYLAPRAGETGFDIAGALELRLGQRFFDGRLLGSMLDRATDPVVARDIASALELILWHVNLASLIDGGIHVGEGGAALDITLASARPTNIVVDAKIVEGAPPAIELKMDLLGVFLGMDGRFTFAGGGLDVHGGLTADLRASARLTLGTASDGTIEVGVSGLTASIGPLDPAFTGTNGDALDGLIIAGGGDFRRLVENLISTQLIPTFTERLPPLLEMLLGAADTLLDDVNFTLDTGLGAPVLLQLDGSSAPLEVRGGTGGHVTVRQNLAIRTTGGTAAPLHASSHGAPQLDTSSAEPVLNNSGLHLTMKQDFLNGLLHALWNAGMLDGQIAIGALTAGVTARLPPVIRPTPASSPCKVDGERCDVILELGQVEVSIAQFGQTFAINATAGARVAVADGAVSLAIQQVPDLRVWQTSMGQGTLTPDLVRGLVADVVWPKLFGAIGANLTIALPLPDLASLGLTDLAPGLAEAELAIQMRNRPTVTGSRLLLGADLQLTTPPPPPP